jgi:hypothetical protein
MHIKLLDGKHLEQPRGRWKDDMKMDLMEVGHE